MPSGDVTISVVTPTYDRAHLLGRLYTSLCNQTFGGFEWLVVDDGSTDNTAALVNRWREQHLLDIRYVVQPNQGKHVALNRGIAMARGTFCAVMDSDDWYVPSAFERMLSFWQRIDPNEVKHFADVEGLSAFADGSLAVTPFPEATLDTNVFDLRYRFGVQGDTVGMFRTDVLRRFPFPEDLGSFIPEALVWDRIGLEYRSRFVNEVWGYKEYQAGGLSDRGIADDVRAAPAFARLYCELANADVQLPLNRRVRASAQYVRFSLHAHVPAWRSLWNLPPPLWGVAAPAGAALYLRDRRRLKQQQNSHRAT